MSITAAEQMFSMPAVVAVTGASRSSIYSWVQQDIFPKPRKLGPRRVGWVRSEVEAWIKSRAVAGGGVQ
jgi:prophage regulatory protein